MAQNITLKAIGLNLSPNQLDMPPGSLQTADNIIIRRDNVIESRRGYKLFGNAMGTLSDRAKQLMTYKQRILRHFSNQLEFDTNTVNSDGEEIFSPFAGTYLEAETGRRIRFIEANGNFYFTTSEGIQKISAKTADDFTTDSGFIVKAGGIKAIDISTRLKVTLGDETDFFTQDSAVAYRVVWGYTDRNNNLILGTPSQRSVIYNSLLELELQDFNRLLEALDNVSTATPASLIDDADYVSTLRLPITASANELLANLISLSTKIDADILYADTAGSTPIMIGGVGSTAAVASNIATITQDTATTGDWTDYLISGSHIFLSGFTGSASVLNGAQTVATVSSTDITFNITTANFSQSPITAGQINSNDFTFLTPPTDPSLPPTDAQLVAMQTYLQNIITILQSEPSTGTPPTIDATAQTDFITPLQITTTASVIVHINIPADVTTNNFFQIYRSDIASATGVSSLSDIVPNDELRLVYEAFPTSADIANGFLEVNDVTPDIFRGAFLYTNSTTGEGILQANDIPPFALDINRFKNVLFYANTRTRHRETINLLGVTQMIADFNGGDTPEITITNGSTTNTYRFVTGLVEETNITAVHDVANSLASKYFLLNSANDLNQYYVWFKVSGTGTDPAIANKTGIEVELVTGDTANTVASKTGNAISIFNRDFDVSVVGAVMSITNTEVGGTTDASAGNSGFSVNVTQQGRGEKSTPEQTLLTCGAAAGLSAAGPGNYFTINKAFNRTRYYVWYQVGTSTDPSVANKTGIQVDVLALDTAAQVATKTAAALESFFNVSVNTTQVTIANTQYGPTINSTIGTLPGTFTISTIQDGALDVLLSTLASPAQAVDETARSFVHVINANPGEIVYAYYLSSSTDVPGKILLEARNLSAIPFRILANNGDTGLSFNPDLSPSVQITAISAANPTIITTASAHGLLNQDQVVISGSDSVPSVDGLYTATVLSATTFSIPVNVTSAGTIGAIRSEETVVTSDNEALPNRIYYSKINQPEAVPIVNFMDVGAKDKQILRIFPLRDSLFVYKEDGLFRISGEVEPFNLSLFDSSCILLAPDSLDISNNLIYGWTTQGIISTSESGVNIMSRPIDIDILKLATAQFTNFKTATWGIGYESDNSYTVYTVQQTSDTVATIGYRYSTLTGSWTTFDKTDTCGVINSFDDRQYLGAGDTNFLEQERKNFNRLDYADRQFIEQLQGGNYFGNILKLTDVSNIKVGDVITQDQTLTEYTFNVLLEKLDTDVLLSPHDYLSTQEMVSGADTRVKLDLLLDKIAADPGRVAQAGFTPGADYLALKSISGTKTITAISASNPTVITTSTPHGMQTGRIVTISGSNSNPLIDSTYAVTVLTSTTFTIPVSVKIAGTMGTVAVQNSDFRDVQASYDLMIGLLNNDNGVGFGNYNTIFSSTLQEAIVIAVNTATKKVTLSLTLPFLVGPITIFKQIDSIVEWSSQTFGDPLGLKHVREATLMFENKAFSLATLSFSSDLLPKYNMIPFAGTTNGIFGFNDFGYNFFGGASNSAPFRTLIPRDNQRCRFINAKFEHKVAREQYAIFGLTLTGEISESSRGYR